MLELAGYARSSWNVLGQDMLQELDIEGGTRSAGCAEYTGKCWICMRFPDMPENVWDAEGCWIRWRFLKMLVVLGILMVWTYSKCWIYCRDQNWWIWWIYWIREKTKNHYGRSIINHARHSLILLENAGFAPDWWICWRLLKVTWDRWRFLEIAGYAGACRIRWIRLERSGCGYALSAAHTGRDGKCWMRWIYWKSLDLQKVAGCVGACCIR